MRDQGTLSNHRLFWNVPPDVMRVAPVPLYNRFEDAHRFVEALNACL